MEETIFKKTFNQSSCCNTTNSTKHDGDHAMNSRRFKL